MIGGLSLYAALFALPAAGADTTAKPSSVAGVLFWDQAQREAGFRAMEMRFPVHVAARGSHTFPLPRGAGIKPVLREAGQPVSLADFMARHKAAGVLVIDHGKVRLETYGLGYGPEGRWTSFSVAKSLTSTLVGAAIADGYINSLDDPVTRYITDLKGGAYDGVTVRQLLTMTSGVKWNEDYTDPNSDVARLFSVKPDPGVDATVSYMRHLPREAAPGAKWVYKTGETNLIGVLVTSATHRTLADYLSEKIWRPFGMEREAVWMVDERGQEAGGCCISMTLHDYGRVGLFMLGGGKAGGKSVLPEGWIVAATHKQADIGEPGHGYGFQWWTRDDGTYDAYGIFGQWIHIDPARALVVVVSSAWPHATDRAESDAHEALLSSVLKTVDRAPKKP